MSRKSILSNFIDCASLRGNQKGRECDSKKERQFSLRRELKAWLDVIYFFTLCFFSTFTISLSAAEVPKKQSAHNQCSLTVGMDHWPPYQVFEPNGGVSGTQVKLLRNIAQRIDCTLTFKKMTYPEALAALEKGDIDMQLNASYTEERTRFAHFSSPYRAEFMLLYSTEKYIEKCQSMTLEQLIRDGFKLAVQYGVAYGPEMRRIQQDPELNKKLYYVKTSVQHIELLREKNLDGVIDDPTVVAYRSLVNSTGDALQACPITISYDPLSFMFSKATRDREFVDRVNIAIEKEKQTDYYRQNWVW